MINKLLFWNIKKISPRISDILGDTVLWNLPYLHCFREVNSEFHFESTTKGDSKMEFYFLQGFFETLSICPQACEHIPEESGDAARKLMLVAVKTVAYCPHEL